MGKGAVTNEFDEKISRLSKSRAYLDFCKLSDVFNIYITRVLINQYRERENRNALFLMLRFSHWLDGDLPNGRPPSLQTLKYFELLIAFARKIRYTYYQYFVYRITRQKTMAKSEYITDTDRNAPPSTENAQCFCC